MPPELEFNQVFVAGCSEGLYARKINWKRRRTGGGAAIDVCSHDSRAERIDAYLLRHTVQILYEIPAELTEYKDFSPNRRRTLASFEDEDI